MKTQRETELEAELQQIREEREARAGRLLTELEPLGAERETLERELERVRTEIRAKASEARSAGASGPKIAAAARMSHQSVYDILKGDA